MADCIFRGRVQKARMVRLPGNELAQGAIDYFRNQERYEIEKAEPSHKLGLFLTALGAVLLGGDVQPRNLCPHPTSDAQIACILTKTMKLSIVLRLVG